MSSPKKPTRRSTTTRKKAVPAAAKSVAATTEAAPKARRAVAKAPAPAPLAAVKTEAGPGTPAGADTDPTMLRRKEFIDRVVARSGVRKGEAKPVIEAALSELGLAIAAGETLNLPPMGKLKIVRQRELSGADVFVCRLRRPHNLRPAAVPSGEDGE